MKFRLVLFLLIFAVTLSGAQTPAAETGGQITVSGAVKDNKGKKGLALCDIVVEGTNIGTVTNADGRFSLVLPDSLFGREVMISKLGYANHSVLIDRKNLVVEVRLVPTARALQELVVYKGDPVKIVQTALKKIPDNYPSTHDLLSAFYRETIQKGKRYTEVSEAFLDLSKSSYSYRAPRGDKARVLKGRKLMAQKASDTLAVKILGGPNLAVVLDFVKNEDFFLDDKELEVYEFSMGDRVFFDGRCQYVVHFAPKRQMHYALMKGTLYIDAESMAFTRAEMEMDMGDKDKVVRSILRKKPAGLRFNPQKISFTIAYRTGDDGRTYLSYIRNEIKFKCDWKKRLFSSTYTAIAELAVVDREEATQTRISRHDAFRSVDSFSDVVTLYWDTHFWQGYNIIEPTEKLEDAVGKLKKSK